ncbi:hypothetical protein Taro_053145 [Colocasia esculenta]|uniref:Uncharacterized protein n=1 Tax=Colocasia esculenta TaxID=4460 RepID=A0A843XLY8_COLES|nr:hypothetical protein [Colocasia esculenta]
MTPTSLSATTQRNPGDRHDNLLHRPLVNSANSQALEHYGSSTRAQRLQPRALWLQTRVQRVLPWADASFCHCPCAPSGTIVVVQARRRRDHPCPSTPMSSPAIVVHDTAIPKMMWQRDTKESEASLLEESRWGHLCRPPVALWIAAGDGTVNDYAGHNDAILFVIIRAAQAPEISSSRALRLAKAFDADGTRTIGGHCFPTDSQANERWISKFLFIILRVACSAGANFTPHITTVPSGKAYPKKSTIWDP